MYIILSISNPFKTVRFQRVQLNFNRYFKIVFNVAGSYTTCVSRQNAMAGVVCLKNRKNIPTVCNNKDNMKRFQYFA